WHRPASWRSGWPSNTTSMSSIFPSLMPRSAIRAIARRLPSESAMSHIEKPAKAGGFSSLQSTMKQVLRSQKTRQNIKNLLRVNQTDGFDCPGCAWGDNDHGAFQFCENGAKAVAWESTGKTVGAAFFAAHSVRQLATQSDYWLEYQGRLTEPLRYNPATDHYEPISWDEAFSLIADTLKGLDSPDEVEFYTSGRA